MSSLIMRKTANSCQKYTPNFFDKSKCMNCFRSREEHLHADHDLTQANISHQGWLLMAPSDTDFTDSNHRNRKWNRRFFLLYEHGMLQWKLDESSFCGIQGGNDLNMISGIADGFKETGHRNSIKIMIAGKKDTSQNVEEISQKSLDSTDSNGKIPGTTLFIKTDDREDFYEWKDVLENFLKERQEKIRHKRRKNKMAMKLRSHTQELVPSHQKEAALNNKNSDFTKTLPKNHFSNKNFNINNKENVSNAITRCKSESNGAEYNLKPISSDKWDTNSSLKSILSRQENQENLKPAGNLANRDSDDHENEMAAYLDMPGLTKGLPKVEKIQADDRSRSISRAERRAKTCRENRRNSELKMAETTQITYEPPAPSLNYANNHSTPGLGGGLNRSTRYSFANHQPNKNHFNSPTPPSSNLTSPLHELIHAKPGNNNVNSSIRRTKSLDRRAYNDSKYGISKFGKLYLRHGPDQPWDVNFAVLKYESLSFFKEEDRALISKYANEANFIIDLKMVKSLSYTNVEDFSTVQQYYEFSVHTINGTYYLAAQTNRIKNSWITEIEKNLEVLREDNASTVSSKSGKSGKSNSEIKNYLENFSSKSNNSSRSPILNRHKTQIQAVSPTPQNPSFKTVTQPQIVNDSTTSIISNEPISMTSSIHQLTENHPAPNRNPTNSNSGATASPAPIINHQKQSSLTSNSVSSLTGSPASSRIYKRTTPSKRKETDRKAKTIDVSDAMRMIQNRDRDRDFSGSNYLNRSQRHRDSTSSRITGVVRPQTQSIIVKPQNESILSSSPTRNRTTANDLTVTVDRNKLNSNSLISMNDSSKDLILSPKTSETSPSNEELLNNYKKIISTAVSRLENLTNANNEENVMSFKDIKMEQKLLHMLDSVIASNEIKEKTLINRLEESRNEINLRDKEIKEEKLEIENQRISIAKINEKLNQENQELQERLKKLELAAASGVGNQPILPPKNLSSSPAIIVAAVQPNNVANVSFDSQKSVDSPPDYVKKLKSLNSDFTENSKNLEYRLGQIQQSKLAGSHASSLNSNSHVEEDSQNLEAHNAVMQKISNSHENREIATGRRRRNRGITASKSASVSEDKELAANASANPINSSSLQNPVSLEKSPNKDPERDRQVKYVAVVANKASQKTLHKLLANNFNKILDDNLINEIAKIVNHSQEQENSVLIKNEKFLNLTDKVKKYDNLVEIFKKEKEELVKKYENKLKEFGLSGSDRERIKFMEKDYNKKLKNLTDEYNKKLKTVVEDEKNNIRKELLEVRHFRF